MKFGSGKCHWTSLMISVQWVRQWLVAIRLEQILIPIFVIKCRLCAIKRLNSFYKSQIMPQKLAFQYVNLREDFAMRFSVVLVYDCGLTWTTQHYLVSVIHILTYYCGASARDKTPNRAYIRDYIISNIGTTWFVLLCILLKLSVCTLNDICAYMTWYAIIHQSTTYM